MTRNSVSLVVLGALMVHVSFFSSAADLRNPDEFKVKAEQQGSAFDLPVFETSPSQIKTSVRSMMEEADRAYDKVAAQSGESVTFESTLVALERASAEIGKTASRVSVISETSTDKDMRDTAVEMLKELEKWSVDLTYREDIYAVVKALEKKLGAKPALKGEDLRLFQESLKDYRRLGMELPSEKKEEIKALKKELADYGNDFSKNISDDHGPIMYALAEVDGVPEDFLKQAKQPDGQFKVNAGIDWEYFSIVNNAKKEESRKRAFVARLQRAKMNNDLLKKIIERKRKIALLLGYPTWADYVLEEKMAKKPKNVLSFLSDIRNGLESGFQKMIAEFKKRKVKDTGDKNAVIYDWDARYYVNQTQKEKYQVDEEALRVFFPLERVLDGAFNIYQNIFGLTFTELKPPYVWDPSVRLFAVTDRESGKVMGAFYLDLFPREGKYTHFAEMSLFQGYVRSDGRYQRPVVALVCNFPPATADKPSLLTHDHVETFFHEFGHGMHAILTDATYGSFSGTSVPRDFVEAPSQMLENWVWDKDVLDYFAADYRDPKKKLPKDTLVRMIKARDADKVRWARSQVAYAMLDMALHGLTEKAPIPDPQVVSRQELTKNYFPVPSETNFAASFGHLLGYDAGYYGYLWAKAISEDLASVFRKSPKRFLDPAIGMRLRREIFAPGESREVDTSIERFLGRKRSLQPFFQSFGINKR